MKRFSLFLVFILLVTLVSCNSETEGTVNLWEEALYLEDTVLGEGEKKIEVEVRADEKSITLTINTDAQTLADALLEHNLIEGEESAYGIYIKKVNSIVADYDVDGYYWSLLKDGEYLMTGAESVEIEHGQHYELVRTK